VDHQSAHQYERARLVAVTVTTGKTDRDRHELLIFQADNGEYEKALATFRELKDRDAASLHNLAVLLALSGKSRTALSYLHLALRSRPDYHDAQYNVAAIREGRQLRLTRRPFRQQVVAMIGV